MKIIEVKKLALPDVKVIKYARFCDQRGYFTEHFRRTDFQTHPALSFLQQMDFLQTNESYSRQGTVRGLHFQWNPLMGKLVRPLSGRLVDMALDIRKGSPSFGQIILYDMPARREADYAEWLWIPPGFAHGVFFPEDTLMEYFCTGQYSPGCEAGISPWSEDIDWSLCESGLKAKYDEMDYSTMLISDKDKNAYSVTQWQQHPNSENFIYGQLHL